MKFTRTELSPANKLRYSFTLGKKDIELLYQEALNAHRYYPETKETHNDRRRLASIAKEFKKALAEAERDGDDGDSVPIQDRASYKRAKEENPMLDITRVEVIDHRPCYTCDGIGVVKNSRHDGKVYMDCPDHNKRGRVFVSHNVDVTSSIQDQGSTLKLFINERDTYEPKKQIDVIIDKLGHKEYISDLAARMATDDMSDSIDYLVNFRKRFMTEFDKEDKK